MWRRVEYSNNWLQALSVPMHLGLKTAPLCLILWCQFMGALVLHSSFRLPPDSNIIQIQRIGAHINLIRDAAFPGPSICLSKFPVKEPFPTSPTGAFMWRRLVRNKICSATFSSDSKSKFIQSLFNTFAPIVCLYKYLRMFCHCMMHGKGTWSGHWESVPNYLVLSQ